ncbi:hypothetical protein HWA77_17040 [Photobacterium damselae subsp. damselae]|uniref:DUF1845 domain-containing protein n=1 Tax=Photobacterium damselae subsp. damselae TaxID=85581 RepID=A0A850QUX7_PHODD|nr:hypothetical protein [Photobacterium damselae subsp. damselae]
MASENSTVEEKQRQPRKPRKYSKPYLTEKMVLKNDTTLQLTYGLIPKVMYSFFTLDVILFYIREKDFAEQVNERANALLDKEKGRIEKLLKAAKSNADKYNITSMPNYTVSQEREFRKYTPLATKFLNIVSNVEEYSILLDALWLNGHIESEFRNSKLKKVRYGLLNFSRQMANLGVNAMAVANDKGISADIESTLNESDYKKPDETEPEDTLEEVEEV